jgi:hypothetical protein
MPPYLGESHESVLNFLSKVDLEQFSDPFLMEDILAMLKGSCPATMLPRPQLTSHCMILPASFWAAVVQDLGAGSEEGTGDKLYNWY